MEEVKRPRVIEMMLEQEVINHRYMTPPKDPTELMFWHMQFVSGERALPVEVIEKVREEVRAWVENFLSKNDRLPDITEGLRQFGIPEPDPRADKPWPPEEDCQGCDKHKNGPHRFGCTIHGAKQTKIFIEPMADSWWKKP